MKDKNGRPIKVPLWFPLVLVAAFAVIVAILVIVFDPAFPVGMR